MLKPQHSKQPRPPMDSFWQINVCVSILLCLDRPTAGKLTAPAWLDLWPWGRNKKATQFSHSFSSSLHLPLVINIHKNRCAAKVATKKVRKCEWSERPPTPPPTPNIAPFRNRKFPRFPSEGTGSLEDKDPPGFHVSPCVTPSGSLCHHPLN